MGNYGSKFLSRFNENRKECQEVQVVTQQEDVKNDDLCTPLLSERKQLIDPRSASIGILRTPIEVNCTPVGVTKRVPTAIPLYLQKAQYLETDIDVVMPPLTPKKQFVTNSMEYDETSEIDNLQIYLTPNVINCQKVIRPIDKDRFKILGLDPRSPAADFDRTPILMPKSLALIKARSQEVLSRRGSYETDVYNSNNSYQDINTFDKIPQIELLPDIVSKALETLDLEKTNELDMSDTCSDSDSDSDSNFSDCEEEITVIKNPKFENRQDNLSISDKQLIVTNKEVIDPSKKSECKDTKNVSSVHIKDDEIKIWHDSLLQDDNVSNKLIKSESIKENLAVENIPKEEIIITRDEDNVKNISLSKVMKAEENTQKKGDNGEKKKIGFKMDGKLKSDEKKIFSPDNKHGSETSMTRTPLSNRSNNGQGILTKSPQSLLKNKTMTTKIQQENTPPHKRYIVKTRNGMQWDSNSTMII